MKRGPSLVQQQSIAIIQVQVQAVYSSHNHAVCSLIYLFILLVMKGDKEIKYIDLFLQYVSLTSKSFPVMLQFANNVSSTCFLKGLLGIR